jgi:hypothetical protein
MWHHFLEKNLSENRLKKRKPLFENEGFWADPGAPREAASYYSL